MEKIVPDVFVIGAMKAGTTSFYNYYFNHPDIALTRSKEHNGFVLHKSKTAIIKSYLNQFENKGKIKVDISPKYSQLHKYSNVAEKIHSLNPDARIIYIVRNPIERALSHYYHDMLRDRVKQKNFEEILTQASNEYVLTSMYFKQLKEYLRFFNRSQILVLKLEDIKGNKAKIERQIKDFLNLENFEFSGKAAYKSDARYKILFYDRIHDFLGEGRMTKLYRLFFYLLNINPPKPELNPKLKKELTSVFKEDLTKLRENFKVFYKL